ncbi:hypothetical protein HZA44_04540 [Candidatus Peregrinibacteria bacterium]|nr:hypothetical protein [Candidatus Peregrinibacteria bacterium]
MKKIFSLILMLVGLGFFGVALQAHAQEDSMPTFNVNLESSPSAPASSPYNWTAPVVKIKVGDPIVFTPTLYQTTASHTGTWSYDESILSCAAEGDLLKCKAIAEGDVRVSTTITDRNADGTTGTVESNFISVTVDNTADTSLAGKLLPDLRISANKIQLVSRRVNGVVKKQYKIHVLISNKGKGKAEDTIRYSIFRAGSMEDKTLTTQGLAAGKSKKVFYYVDAAEKGSKVAFSVDATNGIEESDEANNEVQVTIEKK